MMLLLQDLIPSWLQIYMSEATAALLGPGDNLQADRAESDLDDPDLGVAALVDDAIGGGGRADGGSGAGASSGPPAPGGKRKRKQGSTMFVSAPKKPKNPAAATRRRETAAKAAQYQRQPKVPIMVSA